MGPKKPASFGFDPLVLPSPQQQHRKERPIRTSNVTEEGFQSTPVPPHQKRPSTESSPPLTESFCRDPGPESIGYRQGGSRKTGSGSRSENLKLASDSSSGEESIGSDFQE